MSLKKIQTLKKEIAQIFDEGECLDLEKDPEAWTKNNDLYWSKMRELQKLQPDIGWEPLMKIKPFEKDQSPEHRVDAL